MPDLYNIYSGDRVGFTPEMAAVVLANGTYVATPGEVTGGTPPDPPPLPPLAGGGVQSGPPYSIAGAPVSTSIADDDYVRVLDAMTGIEKRLRRAVLMSGASAIEIDWGNVKAKPEDFPPSSHAQPFDTISDLPAILSGLVTLSGDGFLRWSSGVMTAAAPVNWQALPAAISVPVTSSGGAGPSDTVPLLQWVSPDEGRLYGFGIRWRTDGRMDLVHRWNGGEYTPISMPARTNLGGGFSTSEFTFGGPIISGSPPQRGLLSLAHGSYTRFLRLLMPDAFDANALRLILGAPTGEAGSLRNLQPANSYTGWFSTGTYSATAAATFAIQHSAATANGLQVTGADAGQSPALEAKGADAHINVVVKPKGADGAFTVEAPAGGAAKIVAAGPDASHDLTLYPKGAGVLRLSPTIISGLTAVTAAAGAARVMVHNGVDLVALTVDQLFNSRLVQNSVLAGNLDLKQDRVDVASAATLPVFGGQNVYHYRLTGSPVTLTLPARSPSSNRLLIIRVCIDQDATGGRALSFAPPAGETIQWSGGSMGTIATAANARTWFEFRAIGGETRWDAMIAWKD